MSELKTIVRQASADTVMEHSLWVCINHGVEAFAQELNESLDINNQNFVTELLEDTELMEFNKTLKSLSSKGKQTIKDVAGKVTKSLTDYNEKRYRELLNDLAKAYKNHSSEKVKRDIKDKVDKLKAKLDDASPQAESYQYGRELLGIVKKTNTLVEGGVIGEGVLGDIGQGFSNVVNPIIGKIGKFGGSTEALSQDIRAKYDKLTKDHNMDEKQKERFLRYVKIKNQKALPMSIDQLAKAAVATDSVKMRA